MENPSWSLKNVTSLDLDESTIVVSSDLVRDGPNKTKTEEEDSRIEEWIGSNPNSCVSMKKLLVLDLNGLLADIVSPLAGYKPDIVIGRRARHVLLCYDYGWFS